jgi:hypothetical protein
MTSTNAPAPPRRRRISKRTATVAVSVLGAASLCIGLAAPASAEPSATYIAVGSDTIQYVDDAAFAAVGGGFLGSIDATNPLTGATELSDFVQTKPGTLPIARPGSSGDGWTALTASNDYAGGSVGTLPQGGPNGAADSGQWEGQASTLGSIDMSRASSKQGITNADGAYVNIPYVVDGITLAVSGSSVIPVQFQDEFTTADLALLYDQGKNVVLTDTHNLNQATAPTGASFTIHPNHGGDADPGNTATSADVNLYIPKAGSGTRKDFLKYAGFTSTDSASQEYNGGGLGFYTSKPWILEKFDFGAGPVVLEEHDGSVLNADHAGLYPFSIGQWTAQSKATLSGTYSATAANGGFAANAGGTLPVKDRRHGAQIVALDGAQPLTSGGLLNVRNGTTVNFPFTRVTYHIAPYAALFQANHVGDTAFLSTLGQLLISPSSTSLSTLCKNGTAMLPYGVRVATAGSTSYNNTGVSSTQGNYCGELRTDLRVSVS